MVIFFFKQREEIHYWQIKYNKDRLLKKVKKLNKTYKDKSNPEIKGPHSNKA